MTTRVLSLLVLSACASGAAPPPPTPPPDAKPTVLTRSSTALATTAIYTQVKPQRGVLYIVDGVPYADSAFHALELVPDDIASIIIPRGDCVPMRDGCGPTLIIIHTSHETPPARGSRSRSR